MWAEVEQGEGDDFHRCVIAHFMADLQEDERDELMWDERALAAVDGVSDERAQEYHPSLQVRGFMPSLYLSLADDHRRLGDAAALTSSSRRRGPRSTRWATTLTVGWSEAGWTR